MAIQMLCDGCGVVVEKVDTCDRPLGGGKLVGSWDADKGAQRHLCAECFVWLQGALREHRAEACRVADLVCEPPEAP